MTPKERGKAARSGRLLLPGTGTKGPTLPRHTTTWAVAVNDQGKLDQAAGESSVLVVPATLGQLQIIGISAPSYIQTAQNWLDQLETALRGHFGKNYLPAGYLDLKDLVAAKLSLGFNLMLASLPDILIGTVTSAIIGLSAIVLSGFFLMRGSSVADSLYSLLPGSRQATARALGAEIANVFGSHVSGQLALCAITGDLRPSCTARS